MKTMESWVYTAFVKEHETLTWQNVPTEPGFWWYRNIGPSKAIYGPVVVWRVEESATLTVNGYMLAPGLYTHGQHGQWRRCDDPRRPMLRQWAGPVPRPVS